MSIYSHLSFTMDKKTDKIISLRRKLNSQEMWLILLYMVAFFSFVYCYKNFDIYTNYIYNYFIHNNNMAFTLNLLDVIGLVIAISSSLLISYLLDKVASIKDAIS